MKMAGAEWQGKLSAEFRYKYLKLQLDDYIQKDPLRNWRRLATRLMPHLSRDDIDAIKVDAQLSSRSPVDVMLQTYEEWRGVIDGHELCQAFHDIGRYDIEKYMNDNHDKIFINPEQPSVYRQLCEENIRQHATDGMSGWAYGTLRPNCQQARGSNASEVKQHHGATASPQMDGDVPLGAMALPQMDNILPLRATALPQMDDELNLGATASPQMDDELPLGAAATSHMDCDLPLRATTPPQMDCNLPLGATKPPQMDYELPLGATAAPYVEDELPLGVTRNDPQEDSYYSEQGIEMDSDSEFPGSYYLPVPLRGALSRLGLRRSGPRRKQYQNSTAQSASTRSSDDIVNDYSVNENMSRIESYDGVTRGRGPGNGSMEVERSGNGPLSIMGRDLQGNISAVVGISFTEQDNALAVRLAYHLKCYGCQSVLIGKGQVSKLHQMDAIIVIYSFHYKEQLNKATAFWKKNQIRSVFEFLMKEFSRNKGNQRCILYPTFQLSGQRIPSMFHDHCPRNQKARQVYKALFRRR